MSIQKVKFNFVPLLLVLVFVLQQRPLLSLDAVGPASLVNETSNKAPGLNTNNIYLPAILTPPGPPQFRFITPLPNTSVGGTTFVAIQPLSPRDQITSVNFMAGDVDLGTDTTPADGFRAFLDAKVLPAGATMVTAVATGPGGATTQSISVTIVPNPPDSGSISPLGGVLGTTTGSAIVFRPDTVTTNTAVTVAERTQAQVTAQHGIDWDALGVTFLGDQSVQANAPLLQPIGASSSAGFGNRVQPGQAVVNYRIIPSADGSGNGELVVVNTATVAPNNDVISDPLLQPIVDSVNVQSATGRQSFSTVNETIYAPLGSILNFDVLGFNPFSGYGNVAIWEVDDDLFSYPGTVRPIPSSTIHQRFSMAVIGLPVGPATLYLKNESSGYVSDPIQVVVQEAGTLAGTPEVIINDLLTQLSTDLTPYYNNGQVEEIAFIQLANAQTALAELVAFRDETDDEEARDIANTALHDIALAIQSEMLYQTLHYNQVTSLNLKEIQEYIDLASNAVTAVEGSLKWAATRVTNPATALKLVGVAARLTPIGNFLNAASLAIEVACLILNSCENIPLPTLSILPPGTQNLFVGMGSAPPPGGNGAGNIFVPPSTITPEPEMAGRFHVKIYINGQPTPFTGVTDGGGYFFIPFLPEGEPFVAVAIDRATGENRVYYGTGPATGGYVFMLFDFLTGESMPSIVWDGGGDGVSWHDPQNWDLGRVPVAFDRVRIDVPANITVTHTSGNTTVLALHSENNFHLAGGSLTVQVPSTVNGNFSMNSGTVLRADGVVASFTATGATSITQANFYALNGGKINLPYLTSYSGGGVDRTWQATGAGSELIFPNLTSINTTTYHRLLIDALEGGKIDLSNLPFIGSANVWLFAHGVNSQIDVSSATSFNAFGSVQRGRIETVADGTILMDNLVALDLVDLVIKPTGNMPVQQITSLTSGSISSEDMPLTLTALTNLYQSSVYVTGGGTLSFPGLTSYTGGGADRVWRATGTGSELIFPSLTSIDATTYHRLFIDALEEGKIDLSNLPSIGPANVWLFADGVDGQIDVVSVTNFTAYGTLQRGRIEAVNSGTILLTTGVFNTNIADIFLSDDGTISGGTIELGNDARLQGTGTLQANVVNGGEVLPAGGNAGIIIIDGNYTQTAVGKLITHIGGASVDAYDQLSVTGTAVLDGALEISLINSYEPDVGDTFDILTAVSRTGAFATVTGTSIPNNKVFQVNYLPDGITLEVIPN